MPTIIVRSLAGRLGTLAVGAGVACAVAMIWLSDGVVYGLRALAWGGLLLLATWALWWAPQVRLDDDALTVRNAWRSHRLAWGDVETCRTRWILEVVTRDGATVRASAAQRAGGLSTSMRRRREMIRGAGGDAQDAVVGALGHRAIRGEYLDPGEATYRTHLDADEAGDLIGAYAVRRTDHRRLQARQAHRRERMSRRRGAGTGPGPDSEAAGDGRADGDDVGQDTTGRGAGGARPADAAGGSVTRDGRVRSRPNPVPVVVGCGLLLLLVVDQMIAV